MVKFYYKFICSFNKIITLLILILKMSLNLLQVLVKINNSNKFDKTFNNNNSIIKILNKILCKCKNIKNLVKYKNIKSLAKVKNIKNWTSLKF